MKQLRLPASPSGEFTAMFDETTAKAPVTPPRYDQNGAFSENSFPFTCLLNANQSTRLASSPAICTTSDEKNGFVYLLNIPLRNIIDASSPPAAVAIGVKYLLFISAPPQPLSFGVKYLDIKII